MRACAWSRRGSTVVALGLLAAGPRRLLGDDDSRRRCPTPEQGVLPGRLRLRHQRAEAHRQDRPSRSTSCEKIGRPRAEGHRRATRSVFLDAMQAARRRATSRCVDNPKIKTAVENVNRRAADGCELFKQNKDGTGGI